MRIVDRVDFVKTLRQLRRVAHVVDRLSYGPVRRHRDEFGLHPPSGGIFRIFEAALERVALQRRQLFEDFLLVFLVHSLEQFDGVVGFQFANTLRDRLRLEFLEDFLADGIIDFVERREVEIGSRQFHKADTVVGIERPDQVAEVGFMEFADDLAQKYRIGGVNRVRDLLDEFGADVAVGIPHRETVEHRRVGWIAQRPHHRPCRASPV